MLGFAADSSMRPTRFFATGYTPRQHNEITAYVPLMRRVLPQLERRYRTVPIETTRQLARDWIETRRTHGLSDLPPANLYDDLRSGAKGQIYSARTRLMNDLMRAGEDEIFDERIEEGVSDLLLALEMSQMLKFAGGHMAIQTCRDQIRILEKLMAVDYSQRPDLAAKALAELDTLEDEPLNRETLISKFSKSSEFDLLPQNRSLRVANASLGQFQTRENLIDSSWRSQSQFLSTLHAFYAHLRAPSIQTKM